MVLGEAPSTVASSSLNKELVLISYILVFDKNVHLRRNYESLGNGPATVPASPQINLDCSSSGNMRSNGNHPGSSYRFSSGEPDKYFFSNASNASGATGFTRY